MPRIIRALKKIIINKIEVTAFSVNPMLTKVTLNCLVIFVYIYFTNFARKYYYTGHVVLFTILQSVSVEITK